MTDTPERPPAPRLESLSWVVYAYVVALAAALWVIPMLGSGPPLWIVIAADVVATLVIFFFSLRWNNGSVYDPYWSVVPPLIALFWIGEMEEAVPLRQLVVTTLVFVWGIRLTYNWVRGWPGLHHEDWRYVDLYRKVPLPKWAVSLFAIHLFPTVVVLLACLPLIPALASGRSVWGLLDSIALLVTAGAILVEAVADEQLRRFARTKQPGDIIDRGLWARSRHPNYFGEMSFWWGLFLFGLSANSSYWWTIIGPICMTLMFRLASIPMLDQRSLERRPGYEEHMLRVNAVVPSIWAKL